MKTKIFIILFTLLILPGTAISGSLYEAKTAIKLHQYKKAIKLLTIEAKKNNPTAQYHLALLYHSGKGTRQDYNKAFYWFKKSAVNGNVRAQYNCGVLFENGYGVKVNKQKAIHWYEMSAKQGHNLSKKKLDMLLSKNDTSINIGNIYEEIKKHNIQGVRKILKRCTDINQKDNIGDTPLLAAIKYGNTETIKAILKCNPNTLEKDNTGNTALILAIQHKLGHIIHSVRKNTNTN